MTSRTKDRDLVMGNTQNYSEGTRHTGNKSNPILAHDESMGDTLHQESEKQLKKND